MSGPHPLKKILSDKKLPKDLKTKLLKSIEKLKKDTKRKK
jgi:hypothetical protein